MAASGFGCCPVGPTFPMRTFSNRMFCATCPPSLLVLILIAHGTLHSLGTPMTESRNVTCHGRERKEGSVAES